VLPPDSKPEHAKETLRRHGNVTVRPGRARSLEQAAAGNRAFPHPQIFPLLTEPLTMTLTGRGEGWNLEPMQADTAPVRLFPFPQNSPSENHQQPTRAAPPGPCSFIANRRKSAGRTTGGGRVKSRRLSKATPLGPHRIIANPVFSLCARVRLGSPETQRERFEAKRGALFVLGAFLGASTN